MGIRIGGILVSMLASSAVDCGFETRSSQTKANEIDICCLSTKHAALRSKSKYKVFKEVDKQDLSFFIRI
jgi:hypothetical protein